MSSGQNNCQVFVLSALEDGEGSRGFGANQVCGVGWGDKVEAGETIRMYCEATESLPSTTMAKIVSRKLRNITLTH